jgi:16S rRNA (adenine1518-N6/adenine1519-N6)-dimethyltransferase
VTLSEIRNILDERGIMLTKSLGQNFLHDGNQLRRIADLAEVGPGESVLEVGPGLGPLTELLLERAGHVLAIEMDERLVRFLEERFAGEIAAGKLSLRSADALRFLREESRDWTRWKLVSNLPYSVASPILVELAQCERRPERLVATLQLEVAERLNASPGNSDYGLLTVLTQLNYTPTGTLKIPAGCFFPEPEVDSACVCLVRKASAPLSMDEQRACVMVARRGFSQRRKMMMKLLKADWSAALLSEGFARAGISMGERAEKVSIEQFVILARWLHHGGAAPEVFDVVNERDEVVGRDTRAEVHRLGLMHRAVHVLIFNSAGQAFLQKRSMSKDRHPGVWDSSASGHVDSGEEYGPCAVREAREELGVALSEALQPLFKLPASPETDQEHVWVYEARHDGPFHLNPQEIERGEWLDPKDVSARVKTRPEEFAPAFRHIWLRREQP